MTNTSTQGKPATVSETAKQAGETLARWAWVEATVWTERKLMAPELCQAESIPPDDAHALAHQLANAVNH